MKIKKLLFVMLPLVLVVACGGSGNDISDQNEPVVVAEPEVVVEEPPAVLPPPPVTEEKEEVVNDDLDGDGVKDAADNCPLAANPYQDDMDKDGSGDECDPDIDGDSKPNDADNCAYTYNPAQKVEDADSDGVPVECDMDDTDADVASDVNAIFVSAAYGSDTARGTRAMPVATIEKAALLAGGKKAIYVSGGTYNVAKVEFSSGTRIFGGFLENEDAAKRYSLRNVASLGPEYATKFTRSDAPTTIMLSADGIILNGIDIENTTTKFDDMEPSATVIVSKGAASIERSRISGNSSAVRSIAVWVQGGNVSLARNIIDGAGKDAIGSTSAALSCEVGSVTATNNVLIAGDGRFASGAKLTDGKHIFVNNTVDATSGSSKLGISTAVELVDVSIVFANNILIAANAPDRLALECYGLPPDDESEFANNLFANFPYAEGSTIVRDCDGNGYSDANFTMGEAQVSSNRFSTSGSAGGLFTSSYNLKGSGGAADGVDDGLNTDASNYGGVVTDLFGKARTKGSYDIGAIEK